MVGCVVINQEVGQPLSLHQCDGLQILAFADVIVHYRWPLTLGADIIPCPRRMGRLTRWP